MQALQYLFLCVLVCVLKIVDSAILCEEGFCRGFTLDGKCTSPLPHCNINNATHSGQWLLSPTLCNCCQYCLPYYGDGEHCSLGGPGTGVAIGRCGHGLTCVKREDDFSYCQRMSSDCHTAQDNYDERHEQSLSGALEQRPLCDGKGKYAPYSCIPTQTCFCQSEDGERIFGEVEYQGAITVNNIHCGCSRIHEKIRKNIGNGVTYPVITPRCTSDGNFYPVQCIENICHCVDVVTGKKTAKGGTVDLEQRPLTDLTCYDPNDDLFPQINAWGQPPYNYTSPCLEDMRKKIDFLEKSKQDGYIVDFFSMVHECLPDGTYGRVRITNNGTKICVNERNRRIGEYEANNNTPEYHNMDCKCALTNTLIATSIEKPICCKNGNFRRIQCRRGQCRCVDSDGRQIEKENADVTKLSCYTPDWKDC